MPSNVKRMHPKSATVADTTSANAGQVAEVVPDIEDPVTIAQAVTLTGLSERTLRRRIRAGELRQRRDGRRCVLSRGEVLEMVGKSATATTVPDSDRSDAGQVAEVTALAPALDALTAELASLRRQNEGLHGVVMDLHGQLEDNRKMLTAGDAERVTQAREVGELREDLVRARTSRTWAYLVAGLAGVVAIGLAVALFA